jgi:hypothetical protein
VASKRQIAANRRNAQKSTGPRTLAGKRRSRCNAVTHGLTGETVITVFETTGEYEAFQRLLVSQYRPRSIIEHQLVLRLASLLWRLRRATAIETGLFHIQGRIIKDRRIERLRRNESEDGAKAKLYELLRLTSNVVGPNVNMLDPATDRSEEGTEKTIFEQQNGASSELTARGWTSSCENEIPHILAQCFMRVARLDNQILDRLGRYEMALWKQTAQVIRFLSVAKITKHSIRRKINRCNSKF